MKKYIISSLLALLTLVGCTSNNSDVIDKNEVVNKDQNNKNTTEEDWYSGGDLDDKVDDSHLSKEEQTKNRELGKLDDGRYEIEVVYPYDDRLRFNVLYKFVGKDKQIKDGVGQVSEAGKMPENEDDALTLKLDPKLQGKISVNRHGIFIVEINGGIITSVKS